jgi:endonuclease/exonuclease/phosphatase family metal-dependent hydrolase
VGHGVRALAVLGGAACVAASVVAAPASATVRSAASRSALSRPSAPTNLHITNNSTGTYLTWSSGHATGFTIAQGTDPSLQQNRRTYTIRGKSKQFTPSSLSKGTTYYFRVLARNASTVSKYSAEVSATVATSKQVVTVMTYNVLTDVADGTKQGSGTVAAWNTHRKAAVVKLIRQGDPDVIAIQEGGGWVTSVHGFGGVRQVDSIESALGSTYSLAATENPPTQHPFRRSGNYIIFRNSSYRAVGVPGRWFLDSRTTAAYQMLQNKTTGATFLFVAPHALVGKGAAFDRARASETTAMVRLARAKAQGHRVIYAGDFNSYLSADHPNDGPGKVMRQAHISDGLLVAQSLTHAKYDSANQYLRKPPRYSLSIDHIFAEPGVAFLSWSELLNVSHHRLVGVIPSDHNPVVSRVSVAY